MIKVPSCFACQYGENPPYLILQTRYWKLYLSEEQGYIGGSYLNLVDHKPSLDSLSREEWTDYTQLVKRIEPAYRQAFQADPINWTCLLNDAYASTPPVPHVHWHIRPRHRKPLQINGEDFVDEFYGRYYEENLRRYPNAKTLAAIVKQITACL